MARKNGKNVVTTEELAKAELDEGYVEPTHKHTPDGEALNNRRQVENYPKENTGPVSDEILPREVELRLRDVSLGGEVCSDNVEKCDEPEDKEVWYTIPSGENLVGLETGEEYIPTLVIDGYSFEHSLSKEQFEKIVDGFSTIRYRTVVENTRYERPMEYILEGLFSHIKDQEDIELGEVLYVGTRTEIIEIRKPEVIEEVVKAVKSKSVPPYNK